MGSGDGGTVKRSGGNHSDLVSLLSSQRVEPLPDSPDQKHRTGFIAEGGIRVLPVVRFQNPKFEYLLNFPSTYVQSALHPSKSSVEINQEITSAYNLLAPQFNGIAQGIYSDEVMTPTWFSLAPVGSRVVGDALFSCEKLITEIDTHLANLSDGSSNDLLRSNLPLAPNFEAIHLIYELLPNLKEGTKIAGIVWDGTEVDRAFFKWFGVGGEGLLKQINEAPGQNRLERLRHVIVLVRNTLIKGNRAIFSDIVPISLEYIRFRKNNGSAPTPSEIFKFFHLPEMDESSFEVQNKFLKDVLDCVDGRKNQTVSSFFEQFENHVKENKLKWGDYLKVGFALYELAGRESDPIRKKSMILSGNFALLYREQHDILEPVYKNSSVLEAIIPTMTYKSANGVLWKIFDYISSQNINTSEWRWSHFPDRWKTLIQALTVVSSADYKQLSRLPNADLSKSAY